MKSWATRQLQHPDNPEQFAEAIGVVERMADQLEFVSRSDDPPNTTLRNAIRQSLREYREGPK
jgi:hypothetical protein